jgi:hypothetical protein
LIELLLFEIRNTEYFKTSYEISYPSQHSTFDCLREAYRRPQDNPSTYHHQFLFAQLEKLISHEKRKSQVYMA